MASQPAVPHVAIQVPQQPIPVSGAGGVWMLTVAGSMLIYYFHHLSPTPVQAGKPEDYKALLDNHKAAADQFRDSISFMFDLMVTKTILPIVTLLLGYLFGAKKSS